MENSEWKFSQCFGEKTAYEDLNEADVISAVEFDKSGCYLATGDKGGRVVVFELDGQNSLDGIASSVSPSRRPLSAPLEFRFQSEFQSHEPEFDYLKSLEIEEKVNCIRWCRPSNNSLFLLSTNDKTVKLWKVHEKEITTVAQFNVEDDGRKGKKKGGASGASGRGDKGKSMPHQEDGEDEMDVEETGKEPDEPLFRRVGIPYLRMPKLQKQGTKMVSSTRRVFANAHAYHINSVAVNSDGETFLSADDLRINHWNLDISGEAYNIVDIKPNNMDELSEVITAAEFHPSHCHLFMYSSSRGSIRLGDMRANALCDVHAKTFEEPMPVGNKSFFSEIVASLSDIKFSQDGRYIVTRDYLTLKIWDVNMESKPVNTIKVHEHLRSKLSELYEQEHIFDKFEVVLSADGNNMATGSYDNNFHIYDRYGKMDLCIEASKMPPRQKQMYQEQGIHLDSVMKMEDDDDNGRGGAGANATAGAGAGAGGPLNPRQATDPDCKRKALHMSWHPQHPLVAVAGLNNLYIYSQ